MGREEYWPSQGLGPQALGPTLHKLTLPLTLGLPILCGFAPPHKALRSFLKGLQWLNCQGRVSRPCFFCE